MTRDVLSEQPGKRKSAFAVTSSSMTRTDFELSHPLVEIEFGIVDKFQFKVETLPGSEMITKINLVDKELLDYFMLEHLLPAMQKVGKCYKRSTNELKYRGIAAALYPIFVHLMPTPGDAEILKNLEAATEAIDGLDLLEADALGEAIGSRMVEEQASASHEVDGGSRHWIDFIHEDGGDLRPWQAVDFRGYMRDGKGRDFTLLVTDGKKQDFIWDPATDEESVLYQIADYGCCGGVANVDKGRYKPVHMLALADGKWACAVLHVEGYLIAENGKITDLSFNDFLESKKKKWESENPGGSYTAPPDAAVTALRKHYQDKLEGSKSKMKRLRMDDRIPSSVKLLVGQLVYYPADREWTKFPIVQERRRFIVEDYVLMAGLMRVLFGDRVLSWKKATLEELAKARDKELADLHVGKLV